MRAEVIRSRLLTLAAVGLLLAGCHKNPAAEQQITAGRHMHGRIVLSDGEKPSDVYVWLDGTSIATATDQKGEFQIALPPAVPNVLLGAGVHKLYFYLANYQLSSVALLVRNGQFLYSAGGLNGSGELINTISLLKRLHIETSVEPATVTSDYEGPVNVELSLRATGDSVIVLFPQSERLHLSAIFLKQTETGAVVSHAPTADPVGRDSVKIGPEAYRRSLRLNFTPDFLPPGHYDIVPYFLIVPEVEMPAGLLPSLGATAAEIDPSFLNIPTKRAGGQFIVTGGGMALQP